MMKKRTIAAWMVLTAAMTASISWSPSLLAEIPTARADEPKKTGDDAKAESKLDQLIMASGAIVNGTIVEETKDEIKILVQLGAIKASRPTTYNKADIVEIKRGLKPEEAAGGANLPTTTTKPKDKKPKDKVEALKAETGTDEGTKLYIADLEGLFGEDVSQTPLQRLFEDVDRVFNDIIEEKGGDGIRKVVKPEMREKHVVVLRLDSQSNPQQGFDGIFRAEEIAPVIEEQIQKRGRRVVFWVQNAVNGAAFLPWISPEIYFESDGRMYFTSDLEDFSSGDEMVDEKLVSARFGHAEGFARDGGYDPILIKPMARSKYWLAVRFEGGEPVYLQHKPKPEDGPGWEILTDDGKGENEDKKLRGFNDLLQLDAEWAQKLKVSKGTVDTIDDLAFALGYEKNYKVVESKAKDVMGGWREEVRNFHRMVGQNGRLSREYGEVRVEGNYAERTKARGRQLQLLKQIRSLIIRYKEFADPGGNQVAQIDVLINTIEQEQYRDKEQSR